MVTKLVNLPAGFRLRVAHQKDQRDTEGRAAYDSGFFKESKELHINRKGGQLGQIGSFAEEGGENEKNRDKVTVRHGIRPRSPAPNPDKRGSRGGPRLTARWRKNEKKLSS